MAQDFFMYLFMYLVCMYFKKNLNASRLSEHPPVRGENVKTFRWDHCSKKSVLYINRSGLDHTQ